MQNKKIYIAILGLVILAAVAFYIRDYVKVHHYGAKNNNNSQNLKAVIIKIPATLALASLPKGLPIEASSTVLQSYISVSSSGTKRTTSYSYVSKKTLAGLMADYQKFFTANNWTVTVAQNTDSLKVLSAASPAGSQTLLVNISQNQASGQIVVSLVFIQPAPEDFSKGFPSDFPREAGAQIKYSEESTNFGNAYIMSYASNITLGQNELIFQTYLANQGWAKATFGGTASSTSMSSGKLNVTVNINFSTASISAKPNVTITLNQILKLPQPNPKAGPKSK